jgi:hypothetical protein
MFAKELPEVPVTIVDMCGALIRLPLLTPKSFREVPIVFWA